MPPPSLTLENWLAAAEGLIEECLDAAARHPKGSPEYEVLCSEATELRILRDYVLRTPPQEREDRGESRLVVMGAREGVYIDDSDLEERVASLYDFYHRWKTTIR
jgi:hypothetical protein